MVANSKAVKEAESRRISQIGDFKKRMGGVMELPSGLVVRAQNPGGLKAFLTSGNIPNNLMVIIKKALSTGQAPDAKELMAESGEIDPAMMADMMVMFDSVAMVTVKEPKIYPKLTQADVEQWNKDHPDQAAEDIEDIRREDRLYIDELPEDDKQFLFQWVSGGTRDLEKFREQQERGLADVVPMPKPGTIAKRNARANIG